jgi:hypothetical protein
MWVMPRDEDEMQLDLSSTFDFDSISSSRPCDLRNSIEDGSSTELEKIPNEATDRSSKRGAAMQNEEGGR